MLRSIVVLLAAFVLYSFDTIVIKAQANTRKYRVQALKNKLENLAMKGTVKNNSAEYEFAETQECKRDS